MADLIQRIFWLREKGDDGPYNRFTTFLQHLNFNQKHSFTAIGKQYCWITFSSAIFNDIIHETYEDWLYIKSHDESFIGLSNIYYREENLVGMKDYPHVSTMWILKSDFPRLENSFKKPIQIWLPHHISSPYHRINADLKLIMENLAKGDNPLTEAVDFKIDPSGKRRLR